MSSDDQIRLELPAVPEYGKVARIAATHLARRRGFSAREIDEIRLVMDEVVTLLGDGDVDSQLRVDYGGDAKTIVVDAGRGGGTIPPVSADRLAHFSGAVAPLVDELSVDIDAGRLRFVKTRR